MNNKVVEKYIEIEHTVYKTEIEPIFERLLSQRNMYLLKNSNNSVGIRIFE
jgi:hypothetical protein